MDGMPGHLLERASVKLRVWLAAKVGGPKLAPKAASRVSTRRHGATGTKRRPEIMADWMARLTVLEATPATPLLTATL